MAQNNSMKSFYSTIRQNVGYHLNQILHTVRFKGNYLVFNYLHRRIGFKRQAPFFEQAFSSILTQLLLQPTFSQFNKKSNDIEGRNNGI